MGACIAFRDSIKSMNVLLQKKKNLVTEMLPMIKRNKKNQHLPGRDFFFLNAFYSL